MKKIKSMIKKNKNISKLAINLYKISPMFLYKKIVIRERKDNFYDKHSKIGKRCWVENTHIGYYSGCNRGCNISNTYIGRYVNIAPNVSIGSRNHIYKNFTTHDFIYRNDEFIKEYDIFKDNDGNSLRGYGVKIGHDVWIGERAVICDRVEIGNGAIIAAGAVVTKSVPAYAIVGGVPARFIRWRFTADQIEKLIQINWYEWDIDKVVRNKELLEGIVDFNLERYWEDFMVQRSFINVSKKE